MIFYNKKLTTMFNFIIGRRIYIESFLPLNEMKEERLN